MPITSTRIVLLYLLYDCYFLIWWLATLFFLCLVTSLWTKDKNNIFSPYFHYQRIQIQVTNPIFADGWMDEPRRKKNLIVATFWHYRGGWNNYPPEGGCCWFRGKIRHSTPWFYIRRLHTMWTSYFFEYVCPSLGCLFSGAMYAGKHKRSGIV